ncbi:MAG TPA: CAP domain-containing protein, partial [Candidatus Methanoperedens sp.]
DGRVFNNDNLLGYTQNGNFTTNPEKLRPGLISLNGTYDKQPFEFYFEFPGSSLNYKRMEFSVHTDELKSALFDASVLDIPELEHEVFNLVNEERRKGGIKTLKWNDRVARIAGDYSKILSMEGFHHKDVEGKDAGDRLKENKIFYTVAAENLYMLSGLNGSINISKTIVDGWMSSPGHRSPIMDRDELFSDGAVGIYCEKKTCYAVMVFAGMEHNENIELNPGYVAFRYLYDPTYPFDFDVPVSIDIDSSEYIDIYLVSGKEQYDNFLYNRNYNSIFENKQTRAFSQKVVATKGEGIIIQSGDKSAKINIHFRYS